MNDNEFLKTLQNAEVPLRKDRQTALKEHLLLRHQRPKQGQFFRFFRASLAFTMILVLTGLFLNFRNHLGLNQNLASFISQAKAAYETQSNQIVHQKIVSTDLTYTDEFGWVTSAESNREMWKGPDGQTRSEADNTWTDISMEGLEPHSSHDENIDVYDEYGNLVSYTLLYVAGTELKETENGLEEVPLYSVHPGKQLNLEERQNEFKNQIVCVQEEEGLDFIGKSMFRSVNGTIDGVMNNMALKNNSSQLIEKLDAIQDGEVDSKEIIGILEQIQNDPRLHYELQNLNNKEVAVISFNRADFDLISSSGPLDSSFREDRLVKLYFETENYALIKWTMEENPSAPMGGFKRTFNTEVTFSETLDYEANKSLFEPSSDFVMNGYSDRFDLDFNSFGTGCYKQYEKMSAEETKDYIESAESQMSEMELEMWQNPYYEQGYYLLPGETEGKKY